ncbi:mitotic spindle checkpoint protein Bub3 [Malassezia yamatoensis]|uniref:Mitotic spindle checkpoint protein Bub3 n=1 Tax=Malassezia yamatoensis TaxID=253288 RepID=A0AAJ5YTJ8_9BASI|nr:mitotic spindle checkpoint protein Bub3 [Malassezia yamatoensis]
MILGKHEQGICRIRYDARTQLLVSASWDSSLKVWNPHTDSESKLLHTILLPAKAFAMDIVPNYLNADSVPVQDTKPRMVVAMAERLVYIYDLQSIRDACDQKNFDQASKAEQTRESSLKFMLRDIRCMPDGLGYTTSSIEGRIAVEFFDPSTESQAQKYAFKCHRKEVDGEDVVFPIHAVAFSPRYGTFATGGGDAHCALWDPFAKKRIRQYTLPASISALAFSADGNMLAIATGADDLNQEVKPGDK